ncbi:MAG: lysine 6-dehydrogenase [Thermoproteota archaeon]|nr:lysine 6-dehydrogenase [Thermoproteota archaeon]
MNVLVLGGGLQGSILIRDLIMSDWVEKVIVGSIDLLKLNSLQAIDSTRVEGRFIDVRNKDSLIKLMRDVDVVVNGSNWRYNHTVTEAAIEAGANLIDMGTIFDDVLEKQLKLDEAAKVAKVTVIPCCGLSPGITNILTVYGAAKLDNVDEVHIRCGGIPQAPTPPLGYKVVWSLDGVIDEYLERVTIVKNGNVECIEPLSGLENIAFDNINSDLECFYTQGLSTLPSSLGNVGEMDYKTIRYSGHCEKMRFLASLGLLSSDPIDLGGIKMSPRDFLVKHLSRVLALGSDRDLVILNVNIIGWKSGRKALYSFNMIDFFDKKNNITSMARTTAFPCSIIAGMIAKKEIQVQGVLPPERSVPPESFIARLAEKGIRIDEKFTLIK